MLKIPLYDARYRQKGLYTVTISDNNMLYVFKKA